ncbi:hypothetical protein GCM10022293_11950 [Azospirillum formosense]
MSEGRRQVPAEALVNLRRRLDTLPPRHPDRLEILRSAAELYGVSRATVYRALQRQLRPKGVRRADRGKPRKLSLAEMERYCEIIAALKLRTTNKKGRHLSTARAIELMEEHGVETPDGLVKLPSGSLTRPTADRYLRAWGYDHMRLTRAPAAVRFQARRSNELWQFDMSPSDLKHVKQLLWIEPGRGAPTLMLFSVADDRSGVVYQEYRCVYGEDAESALRFLYNAMAAKPEEDMPFQGIPEAIYMDNGPVTRSRVFQNVMACLGVKVMTHLPAGSDGRRTTARSKGKVERPFRTVKDVHETLYHFHEPQDEAEANLWLRRYLVRYNAQDHRSEPHSRIEDWVRNLPEKGCREMCAWDRFCAFAREPERRKVGIDTRASPWRASPMRSIRTWPAKTWCSGGACSTRNSTLSTATGGMAPTVRSAAPSHCTNTASTRRPNPKNGPTGWPSWRSASACRARLSTAAPRPYRHPSLHRLPRWRSPTRIPTAPWPFPTSSRPNARSPARSAWRWRNYRPKTGPGSTRWCGRPWPRMKC